MGGMPPAFIFAVKCLKSSARDLSLQMSKLRARRGSLKLGHSSSEITRQVYLHSRPEDRLVGGGEVGGPPNLDPNWTQVSTGEKGLSQNVLVQKK